jgi:hypothetical protein
VAARVPMAVAMLPEPMMLMVVMAVFLRGVWIVLDDAGEPAR